MNHFDVDWSMAACRDRDTELFFPVGEGEPARRQVAEAKAVCAECPISDGCLRWALESGTTDGVWGGHTGQERRELRRALTLNKLGLS
jgi:WhiB family redox-sensing transcriptional regulator